MSVAYVAVHGGAGVHDRSCDRSLKQAMHRSCEESLKPMGSSDTSAMLMVQRAICVLEADPALNAGHGSNLTFDGHVECDASIFDGRTGDFSSVGATCGIRHPIMAACKMLEYSRKPDLLGRIPPMTLVSEGARSFAASQGLEIVPPESMVTLKATQEWKKWRQRLDTVGAVTCDGTGYMAAGVSSGGLLLKSPGRIGEAAVYGAGCWAQSSSHNQNSINQGMACSVSGAGEYITRAAVARSVSEALQQAHGEVDTHEILQKVLADFWQLCLERGEHNPNVGILLIKHDEEQSFPCAPRLWCAFTTESMAIAYCSSKHTKPKVLLDDIIDTVLTLTASLKYRQPSYGAQSSHTSVTSPVFTSLPFQWEDNM